MSKCELCEFGVDVKTKLIEMNKNQSWLIEEIRKETGMYADTGYLNKIFTGKRKAPKIRNAISKIFEME